MVKLVQLSNGLSLSYAEYGDTVGFPILTQHGMIASISDGQLFDSLSEKGFRVICIARPGYGKTSAYSMMSIQEWGAIVKEFLDVMDIKKFDVLGISSGSSYAYSILNAIPDQIRKAYIYSGIPALYDEEIQRLWPFEITPQYSIDEFKNIARNVFFSNNADEKGLGIDEKDSMMNNCFGIAQDLKLRCSNWGFRLEDVKSTICIQHCLEDKNVPFITAEMTAKKLENSIFVVKEGNDHFSKKGLDDFINRYIDIR